MKKIALFCLLCSALAAGSIRLYNDSPYKLRAVIRGADGTYLGEMIVLPEHFNTWSSNYPSFGPGGQNYSPSPNRTMTPYSVYWHCMDGEGFGVSINVASGAAAIAMSSSGNKTCKPLKKKKRRGSPYGPTEDDEQLHHQNESGYGESPSQNDSGESTPQNNDSESSGTSAS